MQLFTVAFTFFLCATQTYAMEGTKLTQSTDTYTLLEQIDYQIIQDLSALSNHDNIINAGETIVWQMPKKDLNPRLSHISSLRLKELSDDYCIIPLNKKILCLNKKTIIKQNGEHYDIHDINVFAPLELLIDKISIAQTIACTNTWSAKKLYDPILQAKIALAKFILERTHYISPSYGKGTIEKIIEEGKSNEFFKQPIHYAIARALGTYAISNPTLGLIEENKVNNYRGIVISHYIRGALRASCDTHADCYSLVLQYREKSMPDNLPTNERLNKAVIHLLAGGLQYAPNNEFVVPILISHMKNHPSITNTQYIDETAEKMGFAINITHDSLLSAFSKDPKWGTIKIKNKTNCSIQ